MIKQDSLFNNGSLNTFLEERKSELNDEIWEVEKSQILGGDAEQFKKDLIDKYQLEVPSPNIEKIEQNVVEETVDISQYTRQHFGGESGPDYDQVRRTSFYVPFTGNSELFLHIPSVRQQPVPRGSVINSEIAVEVITELDTDASTVRSQFNQNLDGIKQYLDQCVKHDVDAFNNSLPGIVEAKINRRKAELIRHDTFDSELGFPERK